MQDVAVDLPGTDDTLTWTISQNPILGGIQVGLQVDCGPGDDTIDVISPTVQAGAATIQGGSGDDLVAFDTAVDFPPLYQAGTGTSELDVTGVGTSGVTVTGGAGSESGQLLVDGQPVSSQNAYTNVTVKGTSSSSSAITNTMGPVGSIPNVTFEGGDGSMVTNYITSDSRRNEHADRRQRRCDEQHELDRGLMHVRRRQ